MRINIFLTLLVSAILAIPVYGKVETTMSDDKTFIAYFPYNHNNILDFYVGTLFQSDKTEELGYKVYVAMEIEMPKNTLSKDLEHVKIYLSNDEYIDSDNPNPYINKGNNYAVCFGLYRAETFLGIISFDTFYIYSERQTIENMIALSKYDIKKFVFTDNNYDKIEIPITYPTAGMLREMFRAMISETLKDKRYEKVARVFFAPYLKEFPLNGSTKFPSSAAKSSKGSSTSTSTSAKKTTASKTSTSKASATNATSSATSNSNSAETTQETNMPEIPLQSLLRSPLGDMSPDIYFSYAKASEEARRRFGSDCKAEYDKRGWISVHNTDWLKVGGYATDGIYIKIYDDYTEWSYTFPNVKTLTDAQNLCNVLASKLKALGMELTDNPTNSFPIYYQGMYGGNRVVLSAYKLKDGYHISIDVRHKK